MPAGGTRVEEFQMWSARVHDVLGGGEVGRGRGESVKREGGDVKRCHACRRYDTA